MNEVLLLKKLVVSTRNISLNSSVFDVKLIRSYLSLVRRKGVLGVINNLWLVLHEIGLSLLHRLDVVQASVVPYVNSLSGLRTY